jgi:hypothetical protein
MLNYLNGVDDIGAFKKLKAKVKAKKIKKQAIKLARVQKSQVQKANILTNAIKKGAMLKKLSPLAVTRIKKQAVIDLNRKNFEEQGEPIVSEAPQEILETANEKFDTGLEEIQAPENLNPDEADSDEGGEEIGKLKNYLKKGGLKKAFKDAKKNIKDNAGAEIRKFNPLSVLARNSFLILLKFNVFNLRKHFVKAYQNNFKKLTNWWVGTWGGNMDILLKNLKTQKLGEIGEPVEIATAIIGGATVIISAIALLKDMGIKVDKNENPTGEMEETAIEDNADIGIYYPYMNGVKPKKAKTPKVKKPKEPKKPKAPKTPKEKKSYETKLKNFQNATEKAQQIVDLTKSATDKIFQGKLPIKEKEIVNDLPKTLQKEESKKESGEQTPPIEEIKNNTLLYAGLGAGALLLLMLLKKKK